MSNAQNRALTPAERGRRSEALAAQALQRAGYRIVARNYRSPRFEIDIIARHRGYLVFVEVRSRTVGSMVHPLESIDYKKRQRLILGAQQYVARHGLGHVPIRFDCVSVEWRLREYRLEIFPNAFGLG